MKLHGASAKDVYRRALADGFKKHECLALLMGAFGLELEMARRIGHEVYLQEHSSSSASTRL